MITIHVLAYGELFQQVLKAISSFMNQDSFLGLLRITAFIGIVMASVGYLKSRDPLVFVKWFFGYVLLVQVAIVPKTTVMIDDITSQTPAIVDNVPAVFAITASMMTSIGYGLAQSYDMLFAMPDDLQYTKTGMLFGSRLMLTSHDFRITDPVLKEEMANYFRSCVVGDIRLNRKYSTSELANSSDIWALTSANASPLRMTRVSQKLVTCQEAAKSNGEHSLKAKIDAEIKKVSGVLGMGLFGTAVGKTYDELFTTQFVSAAKYFQNLTDTSANVLMQTMVINGIDYGVSHYQAFTDSTAGVINHEFTKTQVQHRIAWDLAGRKAAWFLPVLHTLLSALLFGIFPLIIALSSIPSGSRILFGYLQFFLSLQFWPVLFAIINLGMTIYGQSQSSKYGGITMANLDKLDELHGDISGVSGYMMLFIPFLAKGFVSSLSEAFSGFATSMTGHLQGSAMSAAGEVASASFGLGQTSFYNTTANTVSANKHDTNWSNMHGMHTEQMGSGVLKTITGIGGAVFDVSPGMTKGAVNVTKSDAVSGSLNQAFEQSKAAAMNEGQHYQTALSSALNHMKQLSGIKGHDMRLGEGVSSADNAQVNKAISTITHTAAEVAERNGVSKEDALAHLTSGGINAHAEFKSDRSVLGGLLGLASGVSGGAGTQWKFDRSSTHQERAHEGFDINTSARESKDFNDALSVVQTFTSTHHLDTSNSEGASLLTQVGADLRDAQTASHNVDASLSHAQRISTAISYVASHSDQVTADLSQVLPAYVESRVGGDARDELYANTGDTPSIQKLQSYANEMITDNRDALIERYGNAHSDSSLNDFHHKNAHDIASHEGKLDGDFQRNGRHLDTQGHEQQLGVDPRAIHTLNSEVNNGIASTKDKTKTQGAGVKKTHEAQKNKVTDSSVDIKYQATNGVIPYHAVDRVLEAAHLKKEKK